MSFKAVDWAIEQRIKSGPKLTLACIASVADDEGKAHCGPDTLAAMVCGDEDEDEGGAEEKRRVSGLRTVNRHVKYLVEKKLLLVTKLRGHGRFLRNEYQLIAEPGRFSSEVPA
jgi:hypothetical protein